MRRQTVTYPKATVLPQATPAPKATPVPQATPAPKVPQATPVPPPETKTKSVALGCGGCIPRPRGSKRESLADSIDQKQIHTTETSQGGGGRIRRGPKRESFADSIDQKQIHSTETSQGAGNDDDTEKAVRRLTLTIDEKITQGTWKTKSLFSSACICRVPVNLRELNNSAYTPRLIIIGPLHLQRLEETPMEHVKLYYANYLFLRLTKGMDHEIKAKKKIEVLQECVKEMKKSVDDAKKSYTEEVWLNEEMMVVDGCFILELLYSYYDLMKEQEEIPINGDDSGTSKPHEGEDSSSEQEVADPIFDSILTSSIVRHDLLLLENQIPLFVLEKLFKLTVERIPNCPHKRSLTDYILFYFRYTMSPEDYSKHSGSATKNSCGSSSDCVLEVSGDKIVTRSEGEHAAEKAKDYYHILHLLHDNYASRGKQTVRNQTSNAQESSQKTKFSEFTLSASNLAFAGVRFKALSGNNLFDIKFDEGKGLYWWCHRASFDIPTIGVHDPTEPFLRNLIAFEQCCPGVSQHFTSYAFLMDMLINSETDVQVLKDANVINNYLGADEDISNLFSNLCKEVVLEEFYFADTCSKASKYSEYDWPKFMAYMKRTYFASPWTFIGFCLAFIAFGTSVIQFVWTFHNKGQ